MAVEIIGGAFLSTLFEKLLDKLGSSEHVNFFREAKVNERLLRKLQITLLSAEQLHGDAEEKQFGNPAVRKWLFELKDAIMAAEELLDEINYEAIRYEHEAKSGSSIGKRLKLCVSGSFRSFDEEINEVRDILEHIMKQKEFYGIKEGVKERTLVRLPAPLAEESRVYGRDDVKVEIVSRLLSDDGDGNKICVIPIVGMGGIGKTTLAQLVYEDGRVKNHFDSRAWATVSDDFDILKITRTVFKDITSKECEFDSLDQLRHKLKEELTKKKFLIVLDDVWNEKYEAWDVLKSHFQSGACGSKIIVTTRANKVVEVMGCFQTHNLGELSDDDCWRLFADHVFGDAQSDSYQALHEIGRKIVKKCKGLPLAVKSLAGLLRHIRDPEEWKRILMSEIWEMQLQENTSNNILPSLWLSYHYLPSPLKRCFTYCSIFPKDYEITEGEKEKIIMLWMAEGLLQPCQKGKRAMDIGDEYFQDLISRSLLQRSSKDRSIFVMHDRVHDLAVFLSGEFCFRLDDKDNTKFSSKTRHFSYSRNDEFRDFGALSVAKSLHTRVRLPLSYESYVNYLPEQELLIPEVGHLRALCISRLRFTVLPNSIGKLKLLRYLNLSYTNIEHIPNTLCSLYYLQTLRLSYCRRLTELPNDMGNLVNLCHLDIEKVPLHKMPHQICNLKDLQRLSQFVLGKNDCCSIRELGRWRHLSGKLAISNLQNVDNVGDVLEANLKDKKYLTDIQFHWSSNNGDDHSQKERDVLDALQPHINMVGLVIMGYGGTELSKWVGGNSYANLISVEITRCNNCLLPPLGQLPSLLYLSVSECHRVIIIGGEFYHDQRCSEIIPFRSLKSLKFEYMLAWKEWLFIEGQQDGGCFPSLEYLLISNCPELNLCFSNYFPSLKTLEIQGYNQTGFLPQIRQMDTAFPSLMCLDIDNCPGLESFLLNNFRSNIKEFHILGYNHGAPDWGAESLPCISIRGCENVMAFPEAHLPATVNVIYISGVPNLQSLNVEGFQHITSLVKLEIKDCQELQCLPGEMLPLTLTSLHIVKIPNLKDLGYGFQHLTSLESLEIEDCQELWCFQVEMLPTSLISLCIRNVPKLEDLGKGFQHLVCLKKLVIEDCEKLQQLPGEGLPTSLTSIYIAWLPNMKYLCKSVQYLTFVEELYFSSCENLESAAEENGKGFQHIISLKKLSIYCCQKLLCLKDEEGLPRTLTSLGIGGFQNLEDLSFMRFQHLVSLEELEIGDCENLQSLPDEGLPPCLSTLWIYRCPLLVPRCTSETGKDWHKIAYIPYVNIDGWEFHKDSNWN